MKRAPFDGAVQAEDIAVPDGPRAFSVAVHDCAFATQDACVRLTERLDHIGPLPLTLLISPRWHRKGSDPRFERWVESRLARGDELVLHGLTHLDDGDPPRDPLDWLRRRVYTAGEAEFAALDEHESLRRLRAGLHWFNERQWPVRGFVAPAWLLGAGAWSVLRRPLFDYTCTLSRLVALPERDHLVPARALPAWSIVYSTRSAWRRVVSVRWNDWLARRAEAAPLLRLELHPGDVAHAAVCDAALRLVHQALAQQREPLTLGGAFDRWLGEPASDEAPKGAEHDALFAQTRPPLHSEAAMDGPRAGA